MVYREVCTEVSETANACTDEQELNKRHGRTDEIARHIKVRSVFKVLLCRFSRSRQKGICLTEGGLHNHGLVE